jgi:hypothetical protein
MGTPPDTEPVLLGADEIADYEQLRSLVSEEKDLALLDDFAKWLFVAAAAVGTLGASFGASSASDLSGTGKRMFAWAVAVVGGSLACAAFARLPLPIRVNRYSDESLAAHVGAVAKVRALSLYIAVVLFVSALILAGFAPLAS